MHEPKPDTSSAYVGREHEPKPDASMSACGNRGNWMLSVCPGHVARRAAVNSNPGTGALATRATAPQEELAPAVLFAWAFLLTCPSCLR